MHPMLNIALTAAQRAGNIVVRFIDRLDTLHVSEKSRNDFVSEADRLSEQEIIQVIHKSYPDHSILAEESGESLANPDMQWIIDPLDGTMNFVHGLPHFSISIAFRMKQQIEIGVVYDPIRQEYFSAARGKGAQLNNRRIRVSNRSKLIDSLIGTGFPFRNRENFDQYLPVFADVFTHSAGVRRAGSAALDLAYVAAGRLDGFWEGSLNIWDIAAGSLLITEAGGMVGDFHGEKNHLTNGNIIAGNPRIYQALLKKIKI